LISKLSIRPSPFCSADSYRVDPAELVQQQLLVLEEKLGRKKTLELEPVDLSVAVRVELLEYAVSFEPSEAPDVREGVK